MAEQRKVALVTGGRRGIGFGIARCLAADGFDLAVCGTSAPEDSTDVVKELEGFGIEALYVRADIADPDQRHALVAAVRDRFGRLDMLVNNAGVAPRVRADILDAGEEEFERVLRINLQGPYFLTQEVANWMVAQGGGTIVFITSISVTVASPNRGEYCVSKAGLGMTARLFAARLAEYGINVYDVRPGVIATDMTSAVKEVYDRKLADGLALQSRWGTPEDLGKAVAALARGDFAYSTGQVFMVDGGLTVQTL